MRVGRLLIVLSIVLILGLVALYAVFNLNGQPSQQSGQTTDIVIVAQPIARGQLVTEDALGYLAYPTANTSANMLTNKSQAVGKLARYDLQPDEPVLASMVVSSPEDLASGGSDTSLVIPSGMVAFPIPIDRFSSLAYGLRAGDHVNVIATLLLADLDANFQTRLPSDTAGLIGPGNTAVVGSQAEGTSSTLVTDPLVNALTAQVISGGTGSPVGQATLDTVTGQALYQVPSESQRPRLVSQTLLQDIVVLHVGNFLYTDEKGNEVSPVVPEGQTSVASPPDLITLIVTPQDAVTLNYLIYAGGDLTLALRSASDDTVVLTEAVTLDYLLNTYDIPVPTKLPYGLEPRIDSLLSPTSQDVLPPAP